MPENQEMTLQEEVLMADTRAERAAIKSSAWLDVGTVPRTSREAHDIEILYMQDAGNGGVSVFVRAWTPDGNQVGFGEDGSIDIERFRFFNPPILVPDGTFQEAFDEEMGETVRQANFREDVYEAIFLSLEQTIKVVKKSGPENISSGKVGNTTSTFYPDANPETTSVDGYVRVTGKDESWAAIIAEATGTAANDGLASSTSFLRIFSTATTNHWNTVTRSIFLFDTSPIGTDTVSAAVFSFAASTKSDTLGANPSANVYASAPASNTTLATGDFATFGSTAFCDTPLALSSVSTSGYNDFTLNATGRAAVVNGITKLGLRWVEDVSGSAPAWASLAASDITGYFADQTGTTSDPKLVVTHSSGGSTTNVSASENPSISESLSRAWTAPRSLSDAKTVADSVNRAWAASRGLADVQNVTETASRSFAGSRTLSDNVPQGESFGRAWSLSRSQGEAMTIAEYVSTGLSAIFSVIVSNAVAVNEYLSRTVSWSRSGDERVSVGEALSRVADYVRSASNEVGISEHLSALRTVTVRLLDQVGINEALLNGRLFTRIATETVSVYDSVSRSWSLANRTISEYVSIIEARADFPLNWKKRSTPTSVWRPRNRP